MENGIFERAHSLFMSIDDFRYIYVRDVRVSYMGFFHIPW